MEGLVELLEVDSWFILKVLIVFLVATLFYSLDFIVALITDNYDHYGFSSLDPVGSFINGLLRGVFFIIIILILSLVLIKFG